MSSSSSQTFDPQTVDLSVVENLSSLDFKKMDAYEEDMRFLKAVFEGWTVKALRGEIQWVLDSMKKVKKDPQELLIFAMDHQYWEVLSDLLEQGAWEAQKMASWPLRYAVHWNKPDAVPVLIPFCNLSEAARVLMSNPSISRSHLDEKGYEAADLLGLALTPSLAEKWLEMWGGEHCPKLARTLLSNALPSSPSKPLKSHL